MKPALFMQPGIGKFFSPLLLLFLVLSFCAKAQERPDRSVFVPPAPNASALGEYGDVPVSYYTGTPSVSVPVKQVETGKLNLAVSLSYHASGNKVDDIASWVGLGWSLNAGGVITRSVRGLPDEDVQGFINEGYKIEDPDYLNSWQYLDAVASGRIDSEPDLYFFNFAGYTGRFIADTEGVYHALPQQDIQINRTETGWNVLAPDGTQYVFGKTGEWGARDMSTVISEQIGSDWQTTKIYPTSYHLALIISADGNDTISFSYTSQTIEYSDIKSEIWYKRFVNRPEQENCPDLTPTETVNSYSVSEHLISEINYNGGSIAFTSSGEERKDLTGGHSLETITHKNPKGEPVKSWQFTYGYFDASSITGYDQTSRYRLKLIQVEEVSANGEPLNPYIFSYNDEVQLPPRKSFQQDYWGFYNDNNANTLVPEFSRLPDGTNLVFTQGADRSPDAGRSQAAILTGIKYPTGGFTRFEFEGHEYGYIAQEAATTIEKDTIGLSISIKETGSKEEYFTVSEPTLALVRCSCSSKTQYEGDEYVEGSLSSYENGSSKLLVSCNPDETYAEKYVTLEPGVSYKLFVLGSYYNESMWSSASVTVMMEKEVPVARKEAGGVRIAKILNFSGQGEEPLVREFDYEMENEEGNPVSSGVLVSFSNYAFLYHNNVNVTAYDAVVCDNYAVGSSPKTGLGATQGSHIGYERVTVKNSGDGSNGKTEYYFTTARKYPDIANQNFPFPPRLSKDDLRGLLTKTNVYDSAGELVSQELSEFSSQVKDVYSGLAVGIRFGGASKEFLDTYGVARYTSQKLWVHKNAAFSKLIEAEDTLVNQQNFYYENTGKHVQLTRKETIVNEQDKLTERYRYAHDLSRSALSGVAGIMQDAHMVNALIEETSWRNDKLISYELIKYDNIPEVGIKPKAVYQLPLVLPLEEFSLPPDPTELLNSLTEEVTFMSYDEKGNVLELLSREGVRKGYIWSASTNQVIAEAVNAGYNQLFYTSFEEDGNVEGDGKTGDKSFIGSFSVSKPSAAGEYILSYWLKEGGEWVFHEERMTGDRILRGQVDEVRVFPREAVMNTYTYKPGIGLSSQTDGNNITTYYEFDDFGRLEYIRDEERNILKAIDYQYGNFSGEPTAH
jgi:hypothetical protein